MSDMDYAQSFLAIVTPEKDWEFSFADRGAVSALILVPFSSRSVVLEFIRLSGRATLDDRLYNLRFWGYCVDKQAAVMPPPPSVSTKEESEKQSSPGPQSSSDRDRERESDLLTWPSLAPLDLRQALEHDDEKVGPKTTPLHPAQTGSARRWLDIKGRAIIQSSESAIFRLGPTLGLDGSASYVSVGGAGLQRGKLAVRVDDACGGFTYTPVLAYTPVLTYIGTGKLINDGNEGVSGPYNSPEPDFEIQVVGSYRQDGTIKFVYEGE